jgi:hypothetical protein
MALVVQHHLHKAVAVVVEDHLAVVVDLVVHMAAGEDLEVK